MCCLVWRKRGNRGRSGGNLCIYHLMSSPVGAEPSVEKVGPAYRILLDYKPVVICVGGDWYRFPIEEPGFETFDEEITEGRMGVVSVAVSAYCLKTFPAPDEDRWVTAPENMLEGFRLGGAVGAVGGHRWIIHMTSAVRGKDTVEEFDHVCV